METDFLFEIDIIFVLLRCSKFKTESTVIIEDRSDCGIFSTVLFEEVG